MAAGSPAALQRYLFLILLLTLEAVSMKSKQDEGSLDLDFEFEGNFDADMIMEDDSSINLSEEFPQQTMPLQENMKKEEYKTLKTRGDKTMTLSASEVTTTIPKSENVNEVQPSVKLKSKKELNRISRLSRFRNDRFIISNESKPRIPDKLTSIKYVTEVKPTNRKENSTELSQIERKETLENMKRENETSLAFRQKGMTKMSYVQEITPIVRSQNATLQRMRGSKMSLASRIASKISKKSVTPIRRSSIIPIRSTKKTRKLSVPEAQVCLQQIHIACPKAQTHMEVLDCIKIHLLEIKNSGCPADVILDGLRGPNQHRKSKRRGDPWWLDPIPWWMPPPPEWGPLPPTMYVDFYHLPHPAPTSTPNYSPLFNPGGYNRVSRFRMSATIGTTTM
mmetsp:Transcript_6047/g.9173  ORF Transcript_6047/g.9173 Transcript_6047/m.9173 type:complete len:394 (-) Transcript_6047:166-1347(-)